MADAVLEVHKIDSEFLRVPVMGTAPLIMNRFSEKAKRQMLDNMQGKKSPKQPRNPEADYQDALYRLDDGTGFGFPAIAFKAATVGGARYYGNSVKMTELRQFLFFRGKPGNSGQALVTIEGEPRMREDYVRPTRSGADLRYRPEFTPWRAIIEIAYVRSALTRESVLSLIDAGGMGVGVGEWRPERDGDFGTYMIDPDRDIEVIDR